MGEELIKEETLELEEIEADVDIQDSESDIETEETVDVVDIESSTDEDIVVEEMAGWVGGDNSKHYSLAGRDEQNQHPIGAITGLRAELDDIKALKTVYSNKLGVADYYEWNDASYDDYGYFVSLVPHTTKIKICEGNDIFGVTVPEAGFVGGQNITPRGNSHGLVATSGLVSVRSETNVQVGDCVVSNEQGCAKKTKSNYGYKVFATEDKNGVNCAVIFLGTQADITDKLGYELTDVDSRLDVVEKNIVSAVNVANQAYNKAAEIVASNQIMSDKVDGALGVVGGLEADVESLGAQVSNSTLISTQAKAIAESAATSAASMKNEAITEANKALAETSKLREELAATTADMNIKLGNSALELQSVKDGLEQARDDLQDNIDDAVKELEDLEKDLKPLATWPEGATGDDIKGIAGFVARADEDSSTLASVTKFEGEFGDAITGFVQEATKENATVKAIASYQQKDENGNPYGPSGASVLMEQVDANKASIDALASLEGEGFTGLAGLTAQVNKNTSSVATLASHVVGEFENTDDWVEDGKDTNIVYYAKNRRLYYYYGQEDQKWHNTTKAYEAGLAGSIAGVQSVADANKAQLDAMVAYDKDGKSALAGLTAYVDENSANISTLAKYSNKDSGNSGVAGLVADVDDNTSTLSAVVNHEFAKNDGTVVTGLAGLNAYVNENESNVSLVANRVAGKYTVVDSWSASGKNESTVYYAKDTKLYWYYSSGWKNTTDAYVAGLPSSIAGIQVVTDDHSSKINSLTEFDTDTTKNLARIEQKADANGAYIQSTVANIDRYSVGPHSQAYGFTLEQAASVLEEGMIYVPTESVTETYNYTDTDGKIQIYTRNFVKGYLYKWGKLTDYPYGWITVDKNYVETTETNTSAQAVYFTTDEPDVSGNFGYWYTDGNTVASPYEPYTLYKWDLPYKYEGEDGNDIEEYHWVAVATLAGNSNNRAVSQIRQDANSIELRVTNTEGSYAGLRGELADTQSDLQTLTSWTKDSEGNQYNLATIKQTADNAGASIAQVVEAVGVDGEVTAASIVTAVTEDESSIALLADNITLDADNINFTATADYSVVAENITLRADKLDFGGDDTEEIKIDANNINFEADNFTIEANKIDFTGEDFTIDADRINFEGDTIFVRPEDLGDDGATTISGDRITTGTLKAINIESDNYTVDSNNKCTAGMKLSLNDATWDSKNFIIDADGNVELTGIITAQEGGSIGGWDIDSNGITKNDMGLMSGTDAYPSLITSNNSPIRIFAGGNIDFEGENRSQNETVSFVVYSKRAVSETINLPSDVARNYRISGARCATTSQTWSGSESNTITIGADEWSELYPEVYVCSKTLTGMYKSWANKSQGKVTYTVNEGSIEDAINISWSGSGILQMDFISLQKVNAKITVKCDYSYTENLNVSVSYTDTAATVQLTPKANVSSSDTLKYILDIVLDLEAKKPKFMVLEDGSLYASAANISGTIDAKKGNIGGLQISDGIIGRDSNNNETFSLLQNGLTINDDLAQISVGNVEIKNIKNQSGNIDTMICANGYLNISGANNTSLKFMSEQTGNNAQNCTITVRAKTIDDSLFGPAVDVWLESTPALYYPISLTIYYQMKMWDQVGGWDASYLYSKTLKFVTNLSSGEHQTIRLTGDNVFNDHIRFGFTAEQCQSNQTSFTMQSVDTTVLTYGTVSQSKKDNTIVVQGNLKPSISEEYMLGDSTKCWSTVYTKDGTVAKSDRNDKNTIQPLTDIHASIFDALQPVSYKFNINNSNRTHFGFIAQDVKAAVEAAGLTTQDFAAYCEWNKDDGAVGCGLRYSEFIALCVDQIQQLKKRVTELEAKIDELTKQND